MIGILRLQRKYKRQKMIVRKYNVHSDHLWPLPKHGMGSIRHIQTSLCLPSGEHPGANEELLWTAVSCWWKSPGADSGVGQLKRRVARDNSLLNSQHRFEYTRYTSC